jgi:hypothetical protein
VGKRATSPSRGKSSSKTGKGSRASKATKGKSSALAYASKIEQLAQDKKRLEKVVREGIDTVSEEIGQFVTAEVDVGNAPELLEKARAEADEKDFSAANSFLDRARTAIKKSAKSAVGSRIEEAQQKIIAIERLGVMEADLDEQIGEARKLLKKDDLMGALSSAEVAAKRAVELAQNQLTEVISISEMLIKDAESEGLDVSKSQKHLKSAKKAVKGEDYDTAVEHTLKIQTTLERARKGLTGEVEEAAIEDLVGEEDREFVSEMIKRGLETLEKDQGTLEEIRGLVSHPENLASKARKALDEGNLTQSRRLVREAQLATIRAMRERLNDVLSAARERVRKAKRTGLNVQEVRSIYAGAVADLDLYKWNEAYEAALSIEDRINQLKEEKTEIENALMDAEEDIVNLSELGTNEARVNELLQQARHSLERGDFKKARLGIAKAVSTAKTSTQNFINNYIIAVRNVLLSVRTVGGNISTARPMLITAKKEMNKKQFGEAVERVKDSILTIKGVDPEYIDTLKELMKTQYNYTLADSLGLNAIDVGETLKTAFQELNHKDYDKAVKTAQKCDFEVEILIEDFKTTSEDLANARESIDEGKKVGADVQEADFLLSKAITQIEKSNFEVAQELLTDAITAAEKARSVRVGALLEDAETVIEEEEKKDIKVDACKELLGEAKQAYKRADYSSTIDLINEAIEVMSESSRRQEMSRESLERAEALLDESKRYAEENPLAEDFISTARNLLTSGQYEESMDVIGQAIVDVEASLAKYIDLIMETTKDEIAKAEEAGASIPKARDMYKHARRYLDHQEPDKALELARKASAMARETLTVFHEVTENLDLLDSYIQWGRRVSRHLEMPGEELETVTGLVKQKKYLEAQGIVAEALEKARQAQVAFVNKELKSLDGFLTELESGGVGTSVARNTLNQAYHSLEKMDFDQAYTLANQAKEQGLKNQELYQEIIEKLHKGKERLDLAADLGVDTKALTDLVEKTEKALINQTYTFALDFVDQLISELPKATQVYINKRFNDVTALLEDSKTGGILVEAQDELLGKAKEVAEQGELEATVETLDRLEGELNSLRERQAKAKESLTHLSEVLEAAGEIGVDTSSPRGMEADAVTAFEDNRFEEVHNMVSNAEDELIRTSSSFIVDYINRVQETLDRLHHTGAPMGRVEDQVDLAWSQLDGRKFTEAFATARECTLLLQKAEERFPTVNDRLRAVEAQVSRIGFMDVEVGDATVVLSQAHEALTDLDFDSVERFSADAIEELGKALKGVAEAQIIELDGLVEATEADGADTAPVRERLDRARLLIDEGEFAEGFLMSLMGMEAADRARREMNEALQDHGMAEEIIKGAEELGADISRAKEILAGIDDDLKERRFRDALNGVRRLNLEVEKAKHSHVLGLLGQGDNALIEAEELGLSTRSLRNSLEDAEERLDARDFHEATEMAQAIIGEARAVKEKFTTTRDRIVEVQSVIYDASSIGTETGAATDLLGEARDALADQRMDVAMELANQSATEVTERQKEMMGFEFETLEDLRVQADEQGMVLDPIDASIAEARTFGDTENYKDSIVRLREGIEEARELLVRFQVAQESLQRADEIVRIMTVIELDAGVPSAEVERVRRCVQNQEYDQAKAIADEVTREAKRALEETMAERVEALDARFTDARNVGIKITDIDENFQMARSETDAADFMAIHEVIAKYEGEAKERMADYEDALQRIEEADTLFHDAEELQVDVSSARPTLDGAREHLAGGRYTEASSTADEAKGQVLELQRQFVLKYIKDAKDLIGELQSLGIDTVEANEYLSQASAALEIEEYPGAYQSAVKAITTSQRVKDQYNEAKQLIEEATGRIKKAEELGADISTAQETLEQAIDSLEFQSYDESKELATKAKERASFLMRDHVESALTALREAVEGADAEGLEVTKCYQLLEKADGHMAEEVFFAAQDLVELGERYLGQRRALHSRAEEVFSRVQTETAIAEAMTVEMSIYADDLAMLKHHHDTKDYGKVIPWGVSLLERLHQDQRSMLELYIGEVMDLLDEFMEKGAAPKTPLETLDKALDHYYKGEYGESHEFVVKTKEAIEEEGRVFEEARKAVDECKKIVIWTNGVGLSVEDARSDLERATGLLESGQFADGLELANSGFERALESIGTAARETLAGAEKRADEVQNAGAGSAMVLDRVDRGRRSLEEDDFGYALLFAHLAMAEARRAEKELNETQEAVTTVKEQVELARKVLDDPTKVEESFVQIMDYLDNRRISEASRLTRAALKAIRDALLSSVQHQLDDADEAIALMGHMEMDSSDLKHRYDQGLAELESERFLEASTIANEVTDQAVAKMETTARMAITESEEAVDVMVRIGTDDAEVQDDLSRSRSMLLSGDYYHSHELAVMTRMRAKERSEKTILDRISEVRSLIESAQSLGVDVTDLERRLEKAERLGNKGHFIDSKEALDDLSDAIDEAQRELVETIVTNCDEMERIAGERELDAGDAAEKLKEAHHHLGLRNYPTALSSSQESFDIFASVFTVLVEGILEDAKNLLINLDVSADIETTSDYFVNAQEAIEHRDYVTALSHADASMTKAREIQISIIETILEETDTEITKGVALKADMGTADDMVVKARHELTEGNLGDAQSLATKAKDEALALQRTFTKTSIQETRMAIEGVPFDLDLHDIEELVEGANASLESGDFEMAIDAAIQARTELDDRLSAHVMDTVKAAEKELKRGESVGIDLEGPNDLLADTRTHIDAGRYLEAQQSAEKCIELIEDLINRHKAAAEALGDLMDLIERATRARAKLGEAMDMQEDAEDAMEEHDYERVMELTAVASGDAKQSYETRVSEAITTAESKLKFLEDMGAMAKLAEDMLSQARESLSEGDLDGSYDYADQSIKEADNAKTAYRDIVDITYQAETIIGTARQFGMDVEEAESKLNEAIANKNEDINRALALAQEAKAIGSALVESFYPDLSVALEVESSLAQDKWTNANLEVRNSGSARALKVHIDISGNLDVDDLTEINLLRGGGKTKKLPIRVKPNKAGEIMVRVYMRCEREIDDKLFEFHDVRWILAEEEDEGGPPGSQFVRKELTCTICQGKIGTQEAPRACSCGATFHMGCAEQLESCPNCGKSIGGA